MVSIEQRGIYSEELLKAVHALDRNKMNELIMNGVDVNGTDKKNSHKNSILITLIQNNYTPYKSHDNNKEAIKMLLNSNAIIDVNYQNNSGGTALYYSLGKDNNSIVKQLIKQGADLTFTDISDNTLLIKAVKEVKDFELVEILIQAGVDLNGVNNKGYTALGYGIIDN